MTGSSLRRRLIVVLLMAMSAALPLAVTPAAAQEGIGTPQPEIVPLESLSILTQGGKVHDFKVEVARTDRQRTLGLMFRSSLAADRGMLFLFSPPEQASFWMRNTIIPLDMIFIRKDGRIANIIAQAEPLSLDLRESAGPVAAVLELAGGSVQRLGLKPGDKVRHPALGEAKPRSR